MKQVLILTEDGDNHAEYVTRLLKKRGADVVVFDPGRYPTRATLSAAVSSRGVARRLTFDDQVVDLDNLSAVWFRRPSEPSPDVRMADSVSRMYVQRECAAFSAELWDGLRCLLVPAPDAVTRSASSKLSQLLLAAELGFEVPATLITTDPDEFLDFYRTHDGGIITKAMEQLGVYRLDDDFCRFTEPVTGRDCGYAEAIRLCPTIVQPYVHKALELRVTVVGTRVFAAEIRSQESNRAHLDWRRCDMRMTPHGIHYLPAALEERCVRLVQRLGLCYGAIDLILRPDGCYVFLEINPSGQYLWIERATDQ